MDSRKLKTANREFVSHFPVTMPSMGWYFSENPPEETMELPVDRWSCMFEYIEDVANGKTVCFSEKSSGCSGAACYLGFAQPSLKAGGFLSSGEKFKENIEYGEAFYRQIKAGKPQKKYLILSSLDQIDDGISVEVVNCWVNPLVLTGLVTLSNFDSPNNDNVRIPFAAGCQSMWTIPYKEKNQKHPRSTIGALDPAMRKHVASDSLLFSVTANRFCIMTENISRSFACDKSWLDLIQPSKIESN